MTPFCADTPVSVAQLRWMRVIARWRGIDVGPACCAVHVSAWIRDHGGLVSPVPEGKYL